MIHTSQCATAAEKWASLEVMHEPKGHQTTMAIMQNIFHTVAEEDANISEHLNIIKGHWERLNMVGNKNLCIPDPIFKAIISLSLPASWDPFTCPYTEGDADQTDPTKIMSS